MSKSEVLSRLTEAIGELVEAKGYLRARPMNDKLPVVYHLIDHALKQTRAAMRLIHDQIDDRVPRSKEE